MSIEILKGKGSEVDSRHAMDTTCTATESMLKRRLAERGLLVPRGLVFRLKPGEDQRSLADRVSSSVAGLAEPYVVKIVHPALTHKTELGAVRLGIPLAGLADAVTGVISIADELGIAQSCEILVEEFVAGGVELFAGMTIDREFGRVGVVGLGGVAVSSSQQQRFVALPITEAHARQLIDWSLRKSLQRVSGMDAVKNLLLDLMGEKGLMLDADIIELDLNPIVVRDGRATILDAWGKTRQSDGVFSR